jgi:hypothetical protein
MPSLEVGAQQVLALGDLPRSHACPQTFARKVLVPAYSRMTVEVGMQVDVTLEKSYILPRRESDRCLDDVSDTLLSHP